MGDAPWIVGALVAVFVAVAGPAGVLVARVQRKTATADNKLAATDLAITGFKDLVQDLQEERDALKQEKAEWRVERLTMRHDLADRDRDIADLKKEIARMKRGTK